MRARLVAAGMMAAIVIAAPASIGRAADGVGVAQLDATVPTGPQRSPRVVIEEPRPPRTVIETEGRGDGRSCRTAAARDIHEGENRSTPDPLCER